MIYELLEQWCREEGFPYTRYGGALLVYNRVRRGDRHRYRLELSVEQHFDYLGRNFEPYWRDQVTAVRRTLADSSTHTEQLELADPKVFDRLRRLVRGEPGC